MIRDNVERFEHKQARALLDSYQDAICFLLIDRPSKLGLCGELLAAKRDDLSRDIIYQAII